jgi:hypothetical protein
MFCFDVCRLSFLGSNERMFNISQGADWVMRTFKISLFVLVAWVAFNLSSWAQSASAPKRFRGTIERITAEKIVFKERSGETLEFKMAEKLSISEAYPESIQKIQANSYIGSAAVLAPDGRLTALEVLIFPEAARGTGEGHYPWDLQNGSTMTNATVQQLSTGANGKEMQVKYKDGEKTIHISDNTPIVSVRPADNSLLVSGAYALIVASKDKEEWVASRITVGRNGFKPPM